MTGDDSPLEALVLGRLTAEDDPALWSLALETVVCDAEAFDLGDGDAYLRIGACSRWLRPHQTRWTAAGGFAWPSGYCGGAFSRRGLPEFDWEVLARYAGSAGTWEAVDRFATKRARVLRVAVPTRTHRHDQAAVNATWVSGPPADARRKVKRFYGFRRTSGVWRCVAVSEF